MNNRSISNQFNLDECIQSVDEYLQVENSKQSYDRSRSKTNVLESIRELLAKLKRQDKDADLNQMITPDAKTSLTIVNAAVVYCDPQVVDFILRNGAKHDNKTLQYALKNRNNFDKLLDVFVANGVDLNAAWQGHSPLYLARREESLHGVGQHIVTSLVNHHASMFVTEHVAEPFLRAKDNVEQAVAGFVFSFIPR